MVRRRGGDGHGGTKDFAQYRFGLFAARAHLGGLADELGCGIADDKAFGFEQFAAFAQQFRPGNAVLFGPADAHEGAKVAEVGSG